MQVVYYIFAAMAGMCAFAFWLAAVAGFSDLERPRQQSPASTWLLHIFSGGWFTFLRSVARHWRTAADLRHLVYYALFAFAVFILLMYLGSLEQNGNA